MCLFEYDEEKHMRSEREAGRKEGKLEGIGIGREEGKLEGIGIGREEGKLEGIEESMLDLLRDGLLEKKVVADKLGISIADVEKKLNKL